MASREGPRASGSDGSDFTHREQVATRYQASTALKSKVKICTYINVAFCLPEAAYILNAYVGLASLPEYARPDPSHHLLLLTSIFSLLHIAALPRNRQLLVQLANLGTLLCGLGGVAYGLVAYFPQIQLLGLERDPKLVLRPPVFMALVWYVLFTLRAVLYIQILYYARQLLATWDTRKTARRTDKTD